MTGMREYCWKCTRYTKVFSVYRVRKLSPLVSSCFVDLEMRHLY